MIRVEPLKQPQSWRGRRYPKGCTLIPEDLAIALGLLQQEEPGEQGGGGAGGLTPDSPHPLVAFLNQAQQPQDLEPLPTIGKGAAKRLFANRPTEGYQSLEQIQMLNPELAQQPFRVDWARVEAHVSQED